ncbi:MAG: AAC(3) family N-acetyltransferase [Pseudomonadota bacterium]
MSDRNQDTAGEARAMAKAEAAGAPITRGSLARELRELGVVGGMLLNVHSALSSLGWVVGGAQAVVDALLEVLGPNGTLAMPTHSSQLTDPANWGHPPAPEAWWAHIRAEMPAYDPACTPTRAMGAIPECFRNYPGVLRSDHPQTSHAALGLKASLLTAEHPLDDLFGDGSPIGQLYALDGHVLLIGVDHGNNTCLHLAEARADFPGKQRHKEGAPIRIAGEQRWQPFEPIQVSDDDFPALGEAFAATGLETRGALGQATARLMRVRDVVDFALPWLEANRGQAAKQDQP